MAGFDGNTGVIVLAATYRPDVQHRVPASMSYRDFVASFNQ
jgi:hypothetical protein